jgi:hypothetical protein
MEHIKEMISSNRQWLEQVFEKHPEIKQIREEFSEKIKTEHDSPTSPMIVTGHQPVIYYPGLLFKDYFVGEMAARMGGSAWNMIVDTDQAQMDIPVPVYANGEWQKTRVQIPNESGRAFTGFKPGREEIEKFLRSVESGLATHPRHDISHAFRKFKEDLHLLLDKGYAFIDAASLLRKQMDATLGYTITDHKVSRLIDTYPYWHFVWYIIKNLDRYTELYNGAVKQGKRKKYQPVRFLNRHGGWHELPFWLEKNGRRLPVMMLKDDHHLLFRSEEEGTEVQLSVARKNEQTIIQELHDSLVLYPKATTLTQIIRLFLSDIFVHGKGAVEYENINNLFLKDFFQMNRHLAFYSVTGDIYLPLKENLPEYQSLQTSYQQKKKQLKEMKRNPEDYLEDDLAESFKQKKKELARQMSQAESPEKRKTIHENLEQLDDEMIAHLSQHMEQLNSELRQYDELLKKKKVYYERTYPYFFYPNGFLTKQRFQENLKLQKHA